MNPKPWDRKLWGIVVSVPNIAPRLVDVWHRYTMDKYLAEPTHALLFYYRRQAQLWARTKTVRYEERGWYFRAVRVRERVKVIDK